MCISVVVQHKTSKMGISVVVQHGATKDEYQCC